MVRKAERPAKKSRATTAVAATTKKMNRGAWTSEEDRKLTEYVKLHGDKKWRTLPTKAGLNRCGKSCRLRWLNYLRPGIKRGNISEDEEDLIIRLHNLIGNRWCLIAGRLPGRTDNEIKNHWNTHLSKKSVTIGDLNSKLKRKFEDGSNCNTVSTIFPEAGPFQPELAGEKEEEEQGGGAAGVVPEFDQVGGFDFGFQFETCHSPAGMWFQPFDGEEYPSYGDGDMFTAASFLDNYDDILDCFS